MDLETWKAKGLIAAMIRFYDEKPIKVKGSIVDASQSGSNILFIGIDEFGRPPSLRVYDAGSPGTAGDKFSVNWEPVISEGYELEVRVGISWNVFWLPTRD